MNDQKKILIESSNVIHTELKNNFKRVAYNF